MIREVAACSAAITLLAGCAKTPPAEHFTTPPIQHYNVSPQERQALSAELEKDSAYWQKTIGQTGVKLAYISQGESVVCDGLEMSWNEPLTPARYCNNENKIVIPGNTYGKFLKNLPPAGRKVAAAVVIAHEYGHSVQAAKSSQYPEGKQPDSENMADCFAGATMRPRSESAKRAVYTSLPHIFKSAAQFHLQGPNESHGTIETRISNYSKGLAGSTCNQLTTP